MELLAYNIQEQENGLRILSNSVGPGRAPGKETRAVVGITLTPPREQGAGTWRPTVPHEQKLQLVVLISPQNHFFLCPFYP